VSGRGAKGPAFISFSQSTDFGQSWAESFPVAAVTSPGCQAPIVGVTSLPAARGGGSGALITSPSGAWAEDSATPIVRTEAVTEIPLRFCSFHLRFLSPPPPPSPPPLFQCLSV
jgi:hypothetical protein